MVIGAGGLMVKAGRLDGYSINSVFMFMELEFHFDVGRGWLSLIGLCFFVH